MKEKTAGAEDKCFCGTPVICQPVEYQGETKLQWKNKADGKAHYQLMKDDSTGETITDDKGKPVFQCRKNQSTATGTQTPEQKTIDSPTFEDDDAIVKQTRELYQRELRIRYALKSETGKEPNDQHVGLYLKLVE